uniref:5'-nucleotidase SurE n=1 Tax=Candidatus Methanogaster sp. ANME-2c ERB4 TaxID=2759911 RepID=A0A7G9XZP7_9EURY|nr:5'-nucleotidase SurE1 [Methanosarcinales archaeon ANME-2c ERB4]QNO41658.1 5'-nucleotidase SurE1 [Methanosarcinales archaeon ANME-2c ERB4]QNO48303.1 5'-nucleotidase SurE1 [Methanosarcinales archaeon ANME-2c ERB4]
MSVILVTNDDGVYSSGIRAAHESVCDLGDVTVAAPSMQKSGVGRSVSVFSPLRMTEIELESFSAYAVGGTPADSVILAIFVILDKLPELCVSGFNIGENISTDTVTTSGTVGAALEAASYGIPTIAASIQVADQGDKFDDHRHYEYDFSVGVDLVRRVAKRALAHGFPEGVDLLNINIPRDALPDTKIEITRLSRKIFKTAVEQRHDPRGRPYYWINGDLVQDDDAGTDVHAFARKHISITPLSLDSTAGIDRLTTWEIPETLTEAVKALYQEG